MFFVGTARQNTHLVSPAFFSPLPYHHRSDPRPRQTFERAYDPYEVADDENEAGYLAAEGNFAQATTTLGGDALNTNRRSAFPAAASFEPPPPPPPPLPPQQERGIVATSEMPPHLRAAFPFRYFNLVQSECFDAAFGSAEPLVVVAPTGAGKTGVLDLALARLLLEYAGGFGRNGGDGGEATHAKALYIAPSRALVQERVADWKRRFGPIGAACAELTGDAGGEGGGENEFGAASASNAAALLDAVTIICATPEKLDATTRHRGTRGGNGGGGRGGFSRSAAFIGDVGLVLLDEVHLLSEAPRGATLEAVVARLRVLGASPELSGRPLERARFVAVSATMPNPGDIGSWLGGADDGARAVVRAFGDEVRPVPLRTLGRAFPDTRTDFLFEKSLNRPLLDVLSEHAAGRPALVFCASRNGASDTAKFVAAAWKAAGRIGNNGAAAAGDAGAGAATPFVRRALEALASSLFSRPLAECARFGVGFHHAGLEPRDRALLEAAFAARQLPCLCTTSTLAVGVNLPAYLVVVKGTRRWCSAGEAAASVGVGSGSSIGGAGGVGSSTAAAAATATTASGAKTTSAASGFVEYDATTILQMVGRSGRPQFDTTGVAVVMTQSSAAARFLELVRGSRPLDSQLEKCLPEHLNAEIVLRTVADVPAAVRWLKATFLWARVRSDPASRGFPRKLAASGGGGDASSASPSPSSSSSTLERLATQRYISSTVSALVSQGFATVDPVDGYSLAPTLAGQLAARHYVRLPTLAAAARAPRHASLPDLLECLCGAAEFSGIALRRSEKKQLAEMNKRAEAEGRPFVVAPESLSAGRSSNPKPKKTISTPREKLLVLVSDALGEQSAEALDYSMRSELDGVLKTGKRIAACVATLFASEASSNSGNGSSGIGASASSSSSSSAAAVPFSFNGNARLAATANAYRLARSLREGCWDGTGAEARQLPGIGRTLSARLAAAGLGTMRALLRADGRDVERATGRPFPFGHQLVAEAAAMAPPRGVSVKVSRPELRYGGGGGGGGGKEGDGSSFARWEFSVTLTRGEEDDDGDDDEGEKENESALHLPRNKKSSSSSSSSFYAKLIVGTPENDHLLLCETVSLTTFRSPYSVRLAAPAAAAGGGGGGGSSWALSADAARPPAVVAAVLHDRVVGLDVVADASSSSHASNPAAAAAAAPPKSRPAPPPSSADAPPAKKAATLAAAAAGRQANLFESFKVVPAAIEEQQQQQQQAARVPEGGREGDPGAAGEGKEKEKGKAAEVAPAPLPATVTTSLRMFLVFFELEFVFLYSYFFFF